LERTLKIYQKRLTNLTARNRSLLLLKLVKSQFIDLHAFHYTEHQSSFKIVEDLIAQKTQIALCSTLDSRDTSTNTASRQLREILRTDQFLYEEQGARDLYVGYPFVQGKMLDDTLVRCPLLFFPVSLGIYKNQWILQPRTDVGVTFNKSFLLAFSHFNQAVLEEKLMEYSFSEHATDSLEFRTELYELLKNSPLELNFGQQTFEDTLSAFQAYTRPEFEKLQETGKLRLSQEAVLGIFPQAGSYLVPDYDYLLAKEQPKDLETFFGGGITQEGEGPQQGRGYLEEELITPYPMDASQEHAIVQVKQGASLVVQGPPGSGKSQLICNLIIDFLARGKNVLVVCQKKAALDVVYQRLGEMGFQPFCGLVHDFRNDRKEIFDKIGRQIECLEKYQKENNSLDTIFLDRQFLHLSREIDRISDELSELRVALFDAAECGITVKELYLSSDLNGPTIPLKPDYVHFPMNAYQPFKEKINVYATYARQLDDNSHPWADRVTFQEFQLSDLKTLKAMIPAILPQFETWQQKAEAITSYPGLSLDELLWIHDRHEAFLSLLGLLQDPDVFRVFKAGLPFTNHEEELWLSNRKSMTLNAYGTNGIEITLPKAQTQQAQEWVGKALEAQQNWYKRLTWKLFAKEKDAVTQLLAANQLPPDASGLQILQIRLDNRQNLEHNLSMLREKPWLIELPEDYDILRLQAWFDLHVKALAAKKIYVGLRNGIRYIRLQEFNIETVEKQVRDLLALVAEVAHGKEQWLHYLSPRQLHSLLDRTLTEESLLRALERDFDSLCEFDRMKVALGATEKLVIDKLLALGPHISPETCQLIFENSLKLCWIEHIESKYPVLRHVSSMKAQQQEKALQEAVKEKQGISCQIALSKLRERTYKEVDYNRLNNMTTYRDLKHQVSKKRNVWPLRKLIRNFSHELLNLVPCWLGSPESVSAIFPMEEFFDLVIFDEASQCFAEKGIPAMYRAKQVVITGDDQQLAPSDLYQPRWEEEIEDLETALEADSLLDLGKHFLQEVSLKGHYRSRSLDLIGFSNKHFYKSELQLIPDFNEYLKNNPAITYLKTDGVWESNANRMEAEKVVALVAELLEQGKKSLGVITFNFRQQALITDLLEQQGIYRPEEVFVKNIENVQGDERDIIIFSIGYAPSPSGKMMAQFGSLNQQKGENRLNVAVTRARLHIYVVASIYPSDLRVDDTLHMGPKLLRQYLQYAREVSEGKFRPVLSSASQGLIRAQLSSRLEALLPEWLEIEKLPFADLFVKNPHTQTLLLTDDAHYYQSISAKDIHAYQPLHFQQKGWPFRRFFSRQLWVNPQGFQQELGLATSPGPD
jgi:hypothetical protein